ncbi:MAG: hypothetical protein Q7R41_09965 [Phycisphaerales bacterium]|nr:hypothetical protein [Phycisphaerales bacterium]
MNLLDELIRICRAHVLAASDGVVIEEPYAPFLPELGRPGSWNRVLVFGEAQNLSSTYDAYVRRLLASPANQRILRLYWEPEVHVRPWDDGTLKLAMSAAFDSEPERFAVSNAVLWSTVKGPQHNETPPGALRNKSAEVWQELLPILDPAHVVTTGTVARNLIAAIKAELGAPWVHVPLCSASPRYLAGQAAKAVESELLRQFPSVADVVRAHPENVAKYRRNKIYFACRAVGAVKKLSNLGIRPTAGVSPGEEIVPPARPPW